MNLFNKSNWCKLHQIANPFKTVSIRINRLKNTCGLVVVLVALSSTILASCSNEEKYAFKSNEDAINKYQFFMSEINKKQDCSSAELCNLICQWQEMADSVFNYISPSAEYTAHCSLSSDFFTITDSIRASLIALASAEPHSFTDVVTIKDQTNAYRQDTTLAFRKEEALRFYSAMDRLPTMLTNKDAALSSYRKFIQSETRKGIHSHEEFMRFLKSEELYYHQFMAHLSEYGDTPLADITANTESVCHQIFEAANANELDADEVMVYMAVRTNRRVLLNARICMDDLKSQRIKDPSQVVAYHWMLLQPFVSIDNLGMALLTESQKQMLYTIAAEYPAIVGKSGTSDARIERLAKELPNQILTLYISSL